MLEQLEPRTVLKLDEPIIIYEGNYTLKSDLIEINLIGMIFFKWFPSHGVVFEGKGNAPGNILNIKSFELLIDNQVLENEILSKLTGMIAYKASMKEFREMDGPEFFTQIRNSIVHGQADKRKKLSQIPETVLREVVAMSIWYVEVILLNILNYQGKYQNRTLKAEWAGQGEELMPWIR